MRTVLDEALSRDLAALLAMAERSGPPALQVGARRFNEALVARAAAEPFPRGPPRSQLSLRLWSMRPDGTLEPWRGRLGPHVCVACDHFGSPGRPALVPLRTCLQRQDMRWPGKRAAVYDYCGSGDCSQGADYRARAACSATGGWVPKSKGGQFLHPNMQLQSKRRRIHLLSRPAGEVPTIDDPPGAPARPSYGHDSEVREILGRGELR